VGISGTGKTTFTNLASGSNLTVHHDLEPGEAETQYVNVDLNGTCVQLIDTPGLGEESSQKEVRNVLEQILRPVQGPPLAGVIYMHRILDNRMARSAFDIFRSFQSIYDATPIQNVMIVTTMWDTVKEETGQKNEEDLETNFFKPALDRGARMTRHWNNVESAKRILEMLIEGGDKVGSNPQRMRSSPAKGIRGEEVSTLQSRDGPPKWWDLFCCYRYRPGKNKTAA